jgi:hypothetical protein
VETEIAAKTASCSSPRAYLPFLGFLLVALAGVLVLSMGMGATKIGVREVVTSLLNGHGSGSTDSVILSRSVFLVYSRQFWWGLRSPWLAFYSKGSSEIPWRIHT